QPVVTAPESRFTSLLQESATPTVNTVSDFATPHIDDVQFPIDVVYTWVDGADPHWQERKAAALDQIGAARDINEFAANASRFVSRDELRYSLRSLHLYAPWVRHVYI